MSKGKYVKRTFPLAGLHCAGCAARVEKILNAQTGVVAASVNLAASTAAVEYDTMQTSPERLRQAVQEGGYDMLADSDDDTPDELERSRNIPQIVRRMMMIAQNIYLLETNASIKFVTACGI